MTIESNQLVCQPGFVGENVCLRSAKSEILSYFVFSCKLKLTLFQAHLYKMTGDSEIKRKVGRQGEENYVLRRVLFRRQKACFPSVIKNRNVWEKPFPLA